MNTQEWLRDIQGRLRAATTHLNQTTAGSCPTPISPEDVKSIIAFRQQHGLTGAGTEKELLAAAKEVFKAVGDAARRAQAFVENLLMESEGVIRTAGARLGEVIVVMDFATREKCVSRFDQVLGYQISIRLEDLPEDVRAKLRERIPAEQFIRSVEHEVFIILGPAVGTTERGFGKVGVPKSWYDVDGAVKSTKDWHERYIAKMEEQRARDAKMRTPRYSEEAVSDGWSLPGLMGLRKQ